MFERIRKFWGGRTTAQGQVRSGSGPLRTFPFKVRGTSRGVVVSDGLDAVYLSSSNARSLARVLSEAAEAAAGGVAFRSSEVASLRVSVLPVGFVTLGSALIPRGTASPLGAVRLASDLVAAAGTADALQSERETRRALEDREVRRQVAAEAAATAAAAAELRSRL